MVKFPHFPVPSLPRSRRFCDRFFEPVPWISRQALQREKRIDSFKASAHALRHRNLITEVPPNLPRSKKTLVRPKFWTDIYEAFRIPLAMSYSFLPSALRLPRLPSFRPLDSWVVDSVVFSLRYLAPKFPGSLHAAPTARPWGLRFFTQRDSHLPL